ncbi:hypothetical protein [Vibrio cyclitrophicus]|uniref:hypothetical protein n=1 Tax=Vibrio cyclitrophicus TaxID=47951 RepID=UPI00148D3112|nr:hypothetical protein [Vibrio cyclitrophicus]NOH21463.1 hypothetical protein [Vibrio cyclitrophicus]
MGLDLLKEYLAAFLTILGWGIVLYNTDRIALRSESKSSTDGCISKLDKLVDLTHEFMHEDKRSTSQKYQYEGKAAAIISNLETKNAYLLRRTSKQFMPSDQLALLRSRLNPNVSKDEMGEGIEIAMDLMESLENTFCSRFSEKWYHYIPYWCRITLVVGLWCLFYFGFGGYFIGNPSNH